MSFNGSGSFLINTAGQPVVSGTVISSTAFNALTADLATGLSTCITKDGQTTVTANIPMANFKFTGLGAGSGAADSANLSQVQSTVVKLLASVSGTDTITAVGSPTVAAYAAGQMFYFVAAGDNTGAVTINIDSLGAKAVTRDGSVALAAGDIKSGEVVVIVYDGTRFQVVSQLNSSGDARFANVSIASALNVGGVATFSAGTAAAPAITTTGDTNTGIFFPAADTIAFAEGGVEAMRIDSSANVGIGTSSPNYQLHVTTNIAVGASGFNQQLILGNNSIQSQLLGTGYTNMSIQALGGNLGVGTTSPSEKLEVAGAVKLTAGNLSVVPSTTTSAAVTICTNAGGTFFAGLDNSTGGTFGKGNYTSVVYNGANTPMVFFTNATERARLTSGGIFLIGTGTASAGLGAGGLEVTDRIAVGTGSVGTPAIHFVGDSNTGFYTPAADTIGFSTGGSERARLTSGGNFGLNTDSVGLKTNRSMGFQVNGGCTQFISHSTSDGSGDSYVEFGYNGTKIGSITQSGTTAVLYNTTSDQRLKTNIVDAPDAAALIDSIKVRSFDWILDESHQRYGMVAQELALVAPEAVHQPSNHDEMMAVDYSKLVPMLVKEIQSLRARVAQLESK